MWGDRCSSLGSTRRPTRTRPTGTRATARVATATAHRLRRRLTLPSLGPPPTGRVGMPTATPTCTTTVTGAPGSSGTRRAARGGRSTSEVLPRDRRTSGNASLGFRPVTAIAPPVSDPTAVMGRRIAAFLLDSLFATILVLAVVFPLWHSQAKTTDLGSTEAATSYCDRSTNLNSGSLCFTSGTNVVFMQKDDFTQLR